MQPKPASQTRTEYAVTPQSLAIVESSDEIEHTERVGRDMEHWACKRPGSGLVQARTDYRDALNLRTSQSVEIKSCQYRKSASQTEGAWRLRRAQHRELAQRNGHYLLIVYQPVNSLPGQERRLEIRKTTTISPTALDASYGGRLPWRSYHHDTYGYYPGVDVPWSRVNDSMS
jgi:hypothetical protein